MSQNMRNNLIYLRYFDRMEFTTHVYALDIFPKGLTL